jgi:hypothetical protein
LKQPLFVLVGAGAGVDISTKFLTDDLLDWDGAPAPVDQALIEDRTPRPFFRWLLNAARSAYPEAEAGGAMGFRPAVGPPNFEELIHIVERLSYLLKEQYYDSVYRRPPPYEVDFFDLSELGRFLAKHKSISMYDVLIGASNHILNVVANRAAAAPHVAAANVVRALDDKFTAKIFSLNYDTRVVDLSDYWWTGFSPMNNADRGMAHPTNDRHEIFRYEPQIPPGAKAFIQLHGSTHFCWIEDYIAPRYKIARWPEPLLKHRTPRRDGFELWNDRSALPALTMVTGFRKGEKTLIEPYLSYLHYLRMEAYRSPHWVIMGYGGGDPHINAVLRSAADYWAQNLRAFVFTHIDARIRDEEAARAQTVRERLRYLGRIGRGAVEPVDEMHTTFAGPTIALTADGNYSEHLDRLFLLLDSR